MTMSSPGFADSRNYAEWLAALLRSRPSETGDAALTSFSRDDLPVGPLYPMARDQPLRRGTRQPVQVFQRVDHPDPARAEALARDDLQGGAQGLVFAFAGAPATHGGGISPDAAALNAFLEAVDIGATPLRLEVGSFETSGLTTALAGLAGTVGPITVDVGLDPLGLMACSGGASDPWAVASTQLASHVARLRAAGFNGPLLRPDGRPHHEAGATEAEELAGVVASGVAYLRALEAEGSTSLDVARATLSFTLAADADEFLGVAKFRALRWLWAQVESSCGLEPRPILLHGETSWRMLTRRDPWSNLLRNALACTAALLGGADSVTVLPHTAALETPDASARRIARNMPFVLLEEAGLARVADPAAGSGAFAALTEGLCRTAWGLFQTIEQQGGMAAAITSGWWQERLASSQTGRKRDLSAGTTRLVGITHFVDPQDRPAEVYDPAIRPGSRGSSPRLQVLQLARERDAEPFESGEARQ